jgi:redox-sensing transcriptional repressor
MRYRKIPDESIRRLPIYLRGLLLLSEQKTKNISSRKLADLVHLNPNKIRKDFSYFGAFGTPGVGYEVAELIKRIQAILRLSKTRKTALVGAGKLGSALLGYPGFKIYGFEIASIFDNDPKKIGKKFGDIAVEDIAKMGSIRKRKINLAIITTPAQVAQKITDALIEKGVNGILNFAPCYLKVPKKVKVITIDIAMDLARMPYYLPAS